MNDKRLHRINKRTYANARVVRWYERLDFIHPAEDVILQKLQPLIKDKQLLDIGIGGGRTTKYLLELSKHYTGLDYSAGFAEIVKRKYPATKILCADARDLPLADEAFDFALFSLNGIDYMDHQDRLNALAQIHRVLTPGGSFVFSTHNRDYKAFNKLPWQEDAPFRLGRVKNCLYTLAHWPRHLMMRKHELFTDEYAIVNDNAHGFALLTYHIGMVEQTKQLERVGFTQIEAYDMEGNVVIGDANFPWTYYLARKRRDPGSGQ